MLLLCLFLLVTSGISAQQPVTWQHISSTTGGIETPNQGDQQTSAAVEADSLHIEAGTISCDVDGDGDADIIAGGDWMLNEVWWWENPAPDLQPDRPWKRYLIRNSGGTKVHDQLTGDFDGDYDILGKPYIGDAPRIDIWLQNGTGTRITKPIKQ
jgi:hypothetical protein